MQPLALSHSTIITSLGAGQAATLTALKAGRSGLAPCAFETVDIPTWVGMAPNVQDYRLEGSLAAYDCRNNRLAAMALEEDGFAEAVAAAREKYGARRIGVFLGTSTSGILDSELAYRARDPVTGALPTTFDYEKTQNTFSLADFVRSRFGLEGPALVISTACASTTKAFGNAARMIAAGLCDAAIVGGADTLCLTTLYGFHSLFLTSAAPCRPFDAGRDGISIGEGAGFTLLEKISGADDSDAVRLTGFGESSDAHHMSSPHPEGIGARLAMERALASAGRRPEEIDYINLHGTATPVGDAAEDKAVTGLFGTATPCSSTKGYTGHTLGAAGIVEAIISALSIRHGYMPGSAQTRALDPALASDYLLDGRTANVGRVVSNSFGFGGSNCSLVLERAA